MVLAPIRTTSRAWQAVLRQQSIGDSRQTKDNYVGQHGRQQARLTLSTQASPKQPSDYYYCGAAQNIASDKHPVKGLVDGFQRADRKSTRLNSSHSQISYAVFCLKK